MIPSLDKHRACWTDYSLVIHLILLSLSSCVMTYAMLSSKSLEVGFPSVNYREWNPTCTKMFEDREESTKFL
jgi:hypothetical protein